MTGSLTDEFQELERLVLQALEGRPPVAPFDGVERIRQAWQRALFSEVGDPCLIRYFSFQLQRIADLSEQLGTPSVPALEEGLSLLTSELLRSYSSFLNTDLFLPKAYQRRWIRSLCLSADTLRKKLIGAAISPGLRDCLFAYLSQYGPETGHCRLSCRAVSYFELLLSRLIELDLSQTGPEERINDLLTDLNFNHLLYLGYRRQRLGQLLSGKSVPDRAVILKTELYLLNIRPEQARHIYHPDWPSIKTMLSAFLQEEIGRCHSDMPEHSNLARAKLPLNLSVAQLACLIWLCYEEGFFGACTLAEIFKVFAAVFSSKRQEHISPGSLSKEYYSISQVNAAVMRDKLSKMVQRINRNFFPA